MCLKSVRTFFLAQLSCVIVLTRYSLESFRKVEQLLCLVAAVQLLGVRTLLSARSGVSCAQTRTGQLLRRVETVRRVRETWHGCGERHHGWYPLSQTGTERVGEPPREGGQRRERRYAR